MKQNHLPAGWAAKQVQDLAAHYDGLSDEQLAEEIEVAPEAEVTAEQAKLWLVHFAQQPIASNIAFAARIVDRLSEADILILFREARALQAELLKPAS